VNKQNYKDTNRNPIKEKNPEINNLDLIYNQINSKTTIKNKKSKDIFGKFNVIF